MPATKGDVRIGSDVWIGTEAMILSGVEIGHGAIIAARSVVTRDVRPYSIVAGVPAREIALRHSEEQIAEPEIISFENGDILPTRHSECQVLCVPQTRHPTVVLCDIADLRRP